jgi:hypothetical protein
MKRFKFIIVIISLFLSSERLHSQYSVTIIGGDVNLPRYSQTGIEFFLLPAFYFNSADLGFVLHKRKSVEYTLLFNCKAVFFDVPSFNLGATFNTNFYAHNGKSFLPLWFRISNTRRIVGYEEGYHPHSISLAIGTGYGRMFKLTGDLKLRCEAGIGLSLNAYSAQGKTFPFSFNPGDYAFHTPYPEQNPLFSPAIKLKCTFVKYFQHVKQGS